MKLALSLPRTLRVLFGIAGRLCIVALIFQVAGVLIPFFAPSAANNPALSPARRIGYGPLSVRLAGDPVTLRTEKSEPTTAGWVSVRGDVSLNLDSPDQELVSALYASVIPLHLVKTVFLILLFGLLRNLCRRIEGGELFSETNLRAVRNLGLLLVAASVVNGMLAIWSGRHLGTYLNQHASLSGIKATISAGEIPLGLFFDYNELITGLLVLLLAEAFRQGLALKKENELTV